MKHIKLFENFEIVYPIKDGEPLNNKEVNFLEGYNVICPEFILKDDNYYYVHDHRCENIKDLPLTYIHGICSKFDITNYTINYDYSLDVVGYVNLDANSLTKIPLKFNRVSEYFTCGYNNLTTLKGSPEYVGGSFLCSSNKLTTLLGSPKKVGGHFSCSFNKLTTLEGGPEYVGGHFLSFDNPLISKISSMEYKGIIKGKLRYN